MPQENCAINMSENNKTIYLNSASHGIPHESVYQRMIEHLTLERNSGPTKALVEVQGELELVRKLAAQMIGAEKDDLAFSTTGTDAWATLVSSMEFQSGRVLVAPHEWGANLVTLELMAMAHNFKIDVLPSLDLDAPDLQLWENCIDDDACAIFVPIMTSVKGLRYPVEAIGKLSRPCHCNYVVDAAQALGQMPVDVNLINCDALVSPTRKWLRGPRQTAILWQSPGRSNTAEVPGHISQRASCKHELLMDYSVANRLGLGVAIDHYLTKSIKEIQSEIMSLALATRRHASDLGLEIVSGKTTRSGIVSIRVPDEKAAAVKLRLEQAGCEVKWPDGSVEPLLEDDTINAAILRISPNCYNTSNDIDIAFNAIESGLR